MPFTFDDSQVKFGDGLGIPAEREEAMRSEVFTIMSELPTKTTAGALRNAVKHIPNTMEEAYWLGGLIEIYLYAKSHQTLEVS